MVSHSERVTILKVFAKRVMRKTFGPKRDDITREWRRLYREQLYDMSSAANFIQVIKSRIINR